MSDLVDRLREARAGGSGKLWGSMMEQAADAIEAQAAEIARLKAAIVQCADWFERDGDRHFARGDGYKARRDFDRATFTRAALEGK